MSRRAANLLLILLAAGVLLHCAHAMFGPHREPYDSIAEDWIYSLVEFAGAALIFARVISQPSRRWPWAAIGIGMLMWSIGDLLWTLWLDNLESPPYPSFVDAIYFASYAGALLRHLRPQPHAPLELARMDRRPDRRFDDRRGRRRPDLPGRPRGDLGQRDDRRRHARLSAARRTAARLRDRRDRRQPLAARPAWLLLAAGLATTAVADAIFNYQSSIGTYVAGSLLDSMWPVAVLFIAAAAWQPEQARIPADRSRRSARACRCCSRSARSPCSATRASREVSPFAVASPPPRSDSALFRAAMLMAENRRLLALATQDSLSDGLTGLANRRALVRDLDAYFAPRRAPDTDARDVRPGWLQELQRHVRPRAGDELLTGLADRLADGGRLARHRLSAGRRRVLPADPRRAVAGAARRRDRRAQRARRAFTVRRRPARS